MNRNAPVHHGSTSIYRGMNAPRSTHYAQGTFGRLFPMLPPLHADRDDLMQLGRSGGPMDPGESGNEENGDVPAGFVFLGQFIDHDITFDPTSSLARQNDPEGIRNFRTPVLELDNVYGSGPHVMPVLYDASDGAKLLVEHEYGRDQLPRNSQGRALISDPRNDENLIVSQIQLAMLKFHNFAVDELRGTTPGHRLFEEAQRLVRWHYQWIVLHEFLPLIVGQDLVNDVYTGDCTGTGRRFYNWRHEPFIPVEFAVAAYRFGHSQVPGRLRVNDGFEVLLFDRNEIGDNDPDDLSGGHRAPRRWVDWKYLFDTGAGEHQPSRRTDTVLSGPLFDLPAFPQGDPSNPASLATRNLLRGHAFGLPSGQRVACAMCEAPLAPGELEEAAALGFDEQTPLWYYLLREAEVHESGKHLGRVGGRIVAEVLVGLLEGDPLSFVRADPKWTPTFGTGGDFNMAALLARAGVTG